MGWALGQHSDRFPHYIMAQQAESGEGSWPRCLCVVGQIDISGQHRVSGWVP